MLLMPKGRGEARPRGTVACVAEDSQEVGADTNGPPLVPSQALHSPLCYPDPEPPLPQSGLSPGAGEFLVTEAGQPVVTTAHGVAAAVPTAHRARGPPLSHPWPVVSPA